MANAPNKDAANQTKRPWTPRPFGTDLPHADPVLSRTFSLSTLLMVITLVCVCLGVTVAAPGLGIPLAVLSVPALIRAALRTAKEQAEGGRPDLATKIGFFFGFFFGSLGVVLLVVVAGCAALCAACFVACGIAGGIYGHALGGL